MAIKHCSNYKGISLLPTMYKVLSSMLLLRLTPYVGEITGIISVDFDVINWLLITFPQLSVTGEKNGSVMGQ
jgi:hypothetical protein